MMGKWFGYTQGTDDEIKQMFSSDYDKYLAGEYSGWPYDRDGKLAAIILLDQFSRMLFRKQAKAFDNDHLSLAIARKIVNDELLYQ